jgi:hypothetical protein
LRNLSSQVFPTYWSQEWASWQADSPCRFEMPGPSFVSQ